MIIASLNFCLSFIQPEDMRKLSTFVRKNESEGVYRCVLEKDDIFPKHFRMLEKRKMNERAYIVLACLNLYLPILKGEVTVPLAVAEEGEEDVIALLPPLFKLRVIKPKKSRSSNEPEHQLISADAQTSGNEKEVTVALEKPAFSETEQYPEKEQREQRQDPVNVVKPNNSELSQESFDATAVIAPEHFKPVEIDEAEEVELSDLFAGIPVP